VRKLIELVLCNIDYAEHDKALVPATHENVTIPAELTGASAVTVDLCDACYELLSKSLERFVIVGEPVTVEEPKPKTRKRATPKPAETKPKRKGHVYPPGGRKAAIERRKRIVRFAQERGLKYETPKGHFWPTKELLRQFAEHEANEGRDSVSANDGSASGLVPTGNTTEYASQHNRDYTSKKETPPVIGPYRGGFRLPTQAHMLLSCLGVEAESEC
jgi:hypothetical protein